VTQHRVLHVQRGDIARRVDVRLAVGAHDVDDEVGGGEDAQQLRRRPLAADAEGREVEQAQLQVGCLARRDQGGEAIEPLVRHLDDGDSRLVGRGVVGQVAGGERLEQRRLAGGGEADERYVHGSSLLRSEGQT